MGKTHDDIDLMQYFDGELDGDTAARVEASLDAGDTHDRGVLDGLDQMGELIRGRLELAADDAEPALDALWGNIERRIQANGETSDAVAEERAVVAPAPATPTASPIEADIRPARPGLWQRLTDWFDGHRAHFMTGALTAGAVAALFLWLRPVNQTQPGPVADAPLPVENLNLAIQPRVESLDVPEGSGTVFTIPGEEDDETGATVILVTFGEDDVEGPI